MDLGLAGQTAVVTGGSKGIGLAVVRALAGSGVTVFAGARKSSTGLDELARTGHVHAIEADLAAADGPATLVAAAGGRVDILVNNVGGAPARPGGFLSITDEDWLATINLDLMAAVRACRAVLPAMLEAGSGSDRHGLLGQRAPARPGGAGLQRRQGRRWPASARRCPRRSGRTGSGSTPSAPARSPPTCGWGGGVAQTVSAATGANPEDVAEQAAGQMVTGRFTQPAEVADLVLFLASSRAANITGADFTIDGGLIPTW